MAAFCDMHERSGRRGKGERKGVFGGEKADDVAGMWRKLGEFPRQGFLHFFSRIRPQHGRMNPTLSFALLGAITVFFWLVAQAWTLLVLWAEGCVTRPAVPGSIHEEERKP